MSCAYEDKENPFPQIKFSPQESFEIAPCEGIRK